MMHVVGPCLLTQRKEGGKDLSVAKAVVACNGPVCFPASHQRLEKSVRAEIQNIQMEYTWHNILLPPAVAAEIMKI